MSVVEAKCPKKSCKGYAEIDVGMTDEGNAESACDFCDTPIGFHYRIEIDGVHILELEEEE